MRLFRVALSVGALAAAVFFLSPADAASRQVYIRPVDGPTGRFEAAPGSSGATINQGDTVYWANQDGDTHTATGQGWSTGNIPPGGEASETFNTPGRFDYACSIHPSMTGSLQVNAVSTPPPPPPPPVTATPMQPAPTSRPTATTRRATATTARPTATTASGVTTTAAGDFSILAPTTTEASTTSTTSGQVAINKEDEGSSNTPLVAALAVGLAAVLGGGAYALARLRRTP